jgi:hypothetical protein
VKARLAALTALILATGAALATPASADTAPVLECGSTITTSCSQTAHFSDLNEWQTPLGAGTGCPSYVIADYVLMVGSGNGVEHNNINKAGDFWATNTFTGDVTLSFYDPANVDVTVVDDQGDITATPTGPADSVVAGHLTQWFGVSDNKQNGQFGFTFSFNGTDQSGAALAIHGNSHANWTPGSEAFVGPPHHSINTASC